MTPGAHPRERRDAQPRPRLPRVRRVRPLHGRPLLRPVPLLPLPPGLAAMLGADRTPTMEERPRLQFKLRVEVLMLEIKDRNHKGR